jgi:hypothetical protein
LYFGKSLARRMFRLAASYCRSYCQSRVAGSAGRGATYPLPAPPPSLCFQKRPPVAAAAATLDSERGSRRPAVHCPAARGRTAAGGGQDRPRSRADCTTSVWPHPPEAQSVTPCGDGWQPAARRPGRRPPRPAHSLRRPVGSAASDRAQSPLQWRRP